MSTRQEELRNSVLEGTKAIWNVTSYLVGFLAAFCLAAVLYPIVTPFETSSTPVNMVVGLLFWLVVLVVASFGFRDHIWRPIAGLARVLNDPRVFKQHCRSSIRGALPYAALFALPLALLCFDFPTLVIAILMGLLIGADTWMKSHRHPRITELVDRALSTD